MEKKSSVNLTKDNNCYYLTQNIGGLSLYEKAKLINRFVKNETKVLENFIDKEIKAKAIKVKKKIKEIDPAAFVIVGTSNDIQGDGFKPIS